MKPVRNFVLVFFINFCSIGFSQVIKLPKNLRKQWVYVPQMSYSIYGYEGNDSVNFKKEDREINEPAFFAFNHEVTNAEYRKFVNQSHNTSMLPDTNSWNSDFELSYNDPMRVHYFNKPIYEDYPVAGVSQWQALQYCAWVEKEVNSWLSKSSKYKNYKALVTLPTELQWESMFCFAYQKALVSNKERYFVSLPKIIKSGKEYQINYGCDRTQEGVVIKDFIKDGGLFPLGKNAFKPSNGFYNISGNVAEWTLSPAYNLDDSIEIVLGDSKVNSIVREQFEVRNGIKDSTAFLTKYDNHVLLKGIHKKDGYAAVKGGSWAHCFFYLQPTVAIYCKPNEQHSYIGFRPILTLVKIN
jgi:formylglycine-generating enzyme required for sulfatase activity